MIIVQNYYHYKST